MSHEGMMTQKTQREEREKKKERVWAPVHERESPSPLAPLFMFFPPTGPALCKLGQPEVILFYLRSSLVSLDLPLKKKKISGLFPSLPCLLATTILDSFFLFEQPNNTKSLNWVWLFATLCNVACQGPLSIGFSRQEYRSALPCPPQGDFSNPGIKTVSLESPALHEDALPLSHQGFLWNSKQFSEVFVPLYISAVFL